MRRLVSKWIASLGVNIGLSVGAGICLLVATVFFSVALWIALAQLTSTLVAAVVLGCLYASAGLVMAAVMIARKRHRHAHGSPTDVIQAFFDGFAQGSKARRKAR